MRLNMQETVWLNVIINTVVHRLREIARCGEITRNTFKMWSWVSSECLGSKQKASGSKSELARKELELQIWKASDLCCVPVLPIEYWNWVKKPKCEAPGWHCVPELPLEYQNQRKNLGCEVHGLWCALVHPLSTGTEWRNPSVKLLIGFVFWNSPLSTGTKGEKPRLWS